MTKNLSEPCTIAETITSNGKIKMVKGEEFIISTYCDIEVVYRKLDMYVNVGKICKSQDEDLRNLLRSKYWKEKILPAFSEVITNSNHDNESETKLIYLLDPGYREFQGYYVHPKLINVVAFLCSVKYCIKVSQYMDLLNEEMMRSSSSFSEMIQRQEKEIQELKTEISKRNAGRIQMEAEIELIPTGEDTFRLKVNQIKTSKKKKDHYYIGTYNPHDVVYVFQYYISRELIEGIVPVVEDGSEFRGKVGTIINIINDAIYNRIMITKPLKEINRLDLKHIDLYKNCKKKTGTKFEIYCSNKYNAPRLSYVSTESLGLNHQDIGIDLIDINRKITRQCKCYIRFLYTTTLVNYFNCVDFINERFEGWTHYLHILKQTGLTSDTEERIKARGIVIIREDYDPETITDDEILCDTTNDDSSHDTTTNDEEISSDVQLSIVKTNENQNESQHDQKQPEPEIINAPDEQTKTDLLTLIEPLGVYDTIRTSSLKTYCQDHKIKFKSPLFMSTLKGLGFEPQKMNGNYNDRWSRENENRTQRLNKFLNNELSSLIHSSKEFNLVYIIPDEITTYCENHNITYDKVRIECYIKSNLNMTGKTVRGLVKSNRTYAVWQKPLTEQKDDEIHQTESNENEHEQHSPPSQLEEQLLQLVEPYKIFDAITLEKLKKFCSEHGFTPRSKLVYDTLHKLNFDSQKFNTCPTKSWLRPNEVLTKRLNDFISNELSNFIHSSDKYKVRYISLDEVKKYCETNDIIYYQPPIVNHIRTVLHMERNMYNFLEKGKRRTRVWSIPYADDVV